LLDALSTLKSCAYFEAITKQKVLRVAVVCLRGEVTGGTLSPVPCLHTFLLATVGRNANFMLEELGNFPNPSTTGCVVEILKGVET
jgi:hypothetical protein